MRTTLGSVENDYERGWQKGSFFMYDPEVKTPLPPKQTGKKGSLGGGGAGTRHQWGGVACALVMLVAVALGRD